MKGGKEGGEGRRLDGRRVGDVLQVLVCSNW